VREAYPNLIVIERDREQGDSVGPPIGVQKNARKVTVRHLGVTTKIYAQSSVEGAAIQDHEHLCDQLVDALIVAIYQWGSESKAGIIPFTESKYLSAGERNEEETWPGVVYSLRYRIPRAVFDKKFDEGAKPTNDEFKDALGVSNRTDVKYTGAPEATPPVVGCDTP
jgi:hypothetical protein